ncbi:hypothetical protein K6U17_14775 [Vibrio fluvialis]|uniref:hypothetical protein n=1 Tax=Vibrio fluvialis TaxID=676 RepID=UPI001EEA630D|nr:hypothetical protein [Vibrio fluvialis]MCG6410483.1 hypothetical protein [Vibrio fluvialis]
MPLLNQVIKAPPREGKTVMLLSLADGYASQGVPGVIIVPSPERVTSYKKIYRPAFDVWSPETLVRYLKKSVGVLSDGPRVFLLEDADRMSSSEGHPKALLERALLNVDHHAAIFSFCCEDITPSRVLMSKENPTGWKLESLTEKLREEINRKSLNIASDPSVEAQLVTNNNFQIIGLLMQVEALQRESMVIMSTRGPDEGPTGKPRLGGQ